MESYVIRHGRSQHNSGLTNDLDSSLTPDGVIQSRGTGNFLAKQISDIENYTLYTSPMLRCLMTTEQMILGAKGRLDKLKVVVEPLIHESLPPNSEEVVIPVRKELFPDYDWSLMRDKDLTIGPDDGKKLIERCIRSVRFADPKSIFISHGSTCLSLALCLSEDNPKMRRWDHSISNASITKILNDEIVWWGRVIYPDSYKSSHLYEDYCKKYL